MSILIPFMTQRRQATVHYRSNVEPNWLIYDPACTIIPNGSNLLSRVIEIHGFSIFFSLTTLDDPVRIALRTFLTCFVCDWIPGNKERWVVGFMTLYLSFEWYLLSPLGFRQNLTRMMNATCNQLKMKGSRPVYYVPLNDIQSQLLNGMLR